MLFPYLLKVSFLLGVLTLSYRWLIKYETFSKINRILLFLNVAAAWSLPLIPLAGWGPVDVQSEFQQKIPVVGKTFPAVFQTNTAEIHSNIKAREAVSNLALEDFLIGAYLLGVLFMSLRLFHQLKGILYTLWSLPWEKLGKRLRLIRDINATSPYSFFYWIICNPETHSREQLQHILAHESMHARQWHSLDLLATELQKIILWFNPIAWFHQRLVQENLEYIADHAVLENCFERKQYQFSLVNVALRTTEIPLTNSFAQTLLKNRIKMMNRKPSKAWALGKYVLLIALLYVSSAFVAPYKEKIVASAPSITKPFFSAILPENKKLPAVTKSLEKSSTIPEPDQVPPAEIMSAQQVQLAIDSSRMTTKGILIKNDTLYWAISALTTWDEINLIKKEIKDFGGEVNINSLKYDPFQTFITSLAVVVKINNGGGSDGFGEEKNEEEFKPVKGHSGFLVKDGLGMGQLPPAPLGTAFKNDYRLALDIQKENQANFFEYKVLQKISAIKIVEITKGPLAAGHIKFSPEQIISISPKKLIQIGRSSRKLDFYLNGHSSNYGEITSIRFENFISAKIASDSDGKTHLLFRAKVE